MALPYMPTPADVSYVIGSDCSIVSVTLQRVTTGQAGFSAVVKTALGQQVTDVLVTQSATATVISFPTTADDLYTVTLSDTTQGSYQTFGVLAVCRTLKKRRLLLREAWKKCDCSPEALQTVLTLDTLLRFCYATLGQGDLDTVRFIVPELLTLSQSANCGCL